MNKKINKKLGAYFRADIADFYGKSNESFRRMCIRSGLAEAMPQILEKRNLIYYKDKPVIEAYLGPSNWTEYIGRT